MIALSRHYPPLRVFDHDPEAAELQQILGPDFATAFVRVCEDDEQIRVEPRGVPFGAIAGFLIVFFGLLTAAPWLLPEFGVRLPDHFGPGIVLAVTLMVWLLIVPTLLLVLFLLQRTTRLLGPGAIVDKRSGELQLPWCGRVVARDRIVRFVELRGRHRYAAGHLTLTGQHCVLFRDDDGAFVHAPFARLAARSRGRGAAQQLADFYDLPLQRIEAGQL